VLLMSMKSQVLSVSFRTQGRVDVEPPSVVDSLRECATASPRAWQSTVDAVVDDVEDEVVEIFVSELSEQSSQKFSSGCPRSLITCQCGLLLTRSLHARNTYVYAVCWLLD
jgi:hypothetical protein